MINKYIDGNQQYVLSFEKGETCALKLSWRFNAEHSISKALFDYICKEQQIQKYGVSEGERMTKRKQYLDLILPFHPCASLLGQ